MEATPRRLGRAAGTVDDLVAQLETYVLAPLASDEAHIEIVRAQQDLRDAARHLDTATGLLNAATEKKDR